MVINRVGPVSCARITGTLYAFLGLFIGACFSVISMVAGAAAGKDMPFGGVLFGVGAIIFFPLLYAAIGFIGTLIFAWLYNVVAGMVGGVEIDVS